MPITNSSSRYGIITKILLWAIAVLFFLQIYWIYMKSYWFEKGSKQGILYLVYYHKSTGVILMGLGTLFILWKLINKKPSLPRGMPAYEVFLAKLTHFILSTVIIVMPLSGILMSMGSGKAIKVFNIWVVPQLIDKNKIIASNAHAAHEWCSYVVLIAVGLHVLAALKHHFIDKDNILKRMIPFK